MKKITSVHAIAAAQALGVAIYVSLIGLIMSSLGHTFDNSAHVQIVAPLIILLLFVLSAAITGSLVLGYPIILFLEKRKAEAFSIFFETLGFMIVILTIAILFAAFL